MLFGQIDHPNRKRKTAWCTGLCGSNADRVQRQEQISSAYQKLYGSQRDEELDDEETDDDTAAI